MLSSFFLTQFSQAIQAYLALDPASSSRIAGLEGKVMTITLLPFSFIFQCEFKAGRVHITAGDVLPAAVKLTGTPWQLLNLALSEDKRAHFFADDLKIEGDAELGQQVAELFDELHIDWEEYLAKALGDVSAHHMARFLRRGKAWFDATKATYVQNVDEYLHEEVKLFPAAEALQDFYNDIDELQMDVDRLEARIAHLIARFNPREDIT